MTFIQQLESVTRGLTPHRAIVSSLAASELAVDLPVVIQPRPEEGQLSSLLLGWDHFAAGIERVMVCLVDHPYVKRSTLVDLAAESEAFPNFLMWSPSYKRRGGHPVIFSKEMMERLRSSPLSEGARPVVRSLGDQRRWLDCDDEAILWDVDTPERYLECKRLYSLRG